MIILAQGLEHGIQQNKACMPKKIAIARKLIGLLDVSTIAEKLDSVSNKLTHSRSNQPKIAIGV